MFKVAKSQLSAKSKPDIWSDGKQYVPLDTASLLRVSGIEARRCAARVWTKGSKRAAELSMSVEDGLGAGLVGKAGRAARLLPARPAVVRHLARASRLAEKAAQVVDHQAQVIEPLEFVDLQSFMDQRRQQAAAEAAEKVRKDNLALSARTRAASLARRHAEMPMAGDAAMAEPGGAAAVEVATSAPGFSVGLEELMAIRSVLAEVPEPVIEPAPPAAPEPAPRVTRVFSGDADQPRGLADAHGANGTAAQAPGKLRVWAGAAIRLLGRAAGWLARKTWRLVGRQVIAALAWVLGWSMVAVLLPYGIYAAIAAHLKGQDLRYFE